MLRKTFFVACGAALLCAAPAHAQGTFERGFVAGSISRYRVELAVRSEMEGLSAVESAEKAYLKPIVQVFEMTLSWRATRRVVSVAPDGTAAIEETLDEFSAVEVTSPAGTSQAADAEARELREALRDSLDRWRRAEPHTLRYRETKLGQLTGVNRQDGPLLDDQPPLVTLWLLRALRPTATLPARSFLPSSQWQEPREVRIEGWNNVTGTESGEWLTGAAATSAEPATVRLHVVQQISASVPAGSVDAAGEGRFHAESLSTMTLGGGADPRFGAGHLLAATRSASREITRVLDPVAGLPEQPRFRARISAQVQITTLQ